MTTKIRLNQVYPIPASASNSELTGTPTAPTPSTNDDSTKIATTEYVKDNLDNYLPLSGASLTGNFYGRPVVGSMSTATGDDTVILFASKDNTLLKGDTIDSNRYFVLGCATDSTGEITNEHKYGQIQTSVLTNGRVVTQLIALKNVEGNGDQASINIGYNESNQPFTSAPTPAATDNSTQIATTAYVKSNLNNYLPLSGGELTGSFYGKPYVDATSNSVASDNVMMIIKDPSTVKGSLPESNHWFTLGIATDSTGSVENGHKFGQVETALRVTGATETKINAYKNELNTNQQASIIVGWDASGNKFTEAPTPATSDNSTQIATTAYVKSNLNSYLPLTGGTISGTLTIGTSGCTLSYNSTNKCLDFIFS